MLVRFPDVSPDEKYIKALYIVRKKAIFKFLNVFFFLCLLRMVKQDVIFHSHFALQNMFSSGIYASFWEYRQALINVIFYNKIMKSIILSFFIEENKFCATNDILEQSGGCENNK